jgi:hypothetical protein
MSRILLVVYSVLFLVSSGVSAQTTVEITLLRFTEPSDLKKKPELFTKGVPIWSISLSANSDSESYSSTRIGNQTLEATVHLQEKEDGLEISVSASESIELGEGQGRNTRAAFTSGVRVVYGKECVFAFQRVGKNHYYFSFVVKKD